MFLNRKFVNVGALEVSKSVFIEDEELKPEKRVEQARVVVKKYQINLKDLVELLQKVNNLSRPKKWMSFSLGLLQDPFMYWLVAKSGIIRYEGAFEELDINSFQIANHSWEKEDSLRIHYLPGIEIGRELLDRYYKNVDEVKSRFIKSDVQELLSLKMVGKRPVNLSHLSLLGDIEFDIQLEKELLLYMVFAANNIKNFEMNDVSVLIKKDGDEEILIVDKLSDEAFFGDRKEFPLRFILE